MDFQSSVLKETNVIHQSRTIFAHTTNEPLKPEWVDVSEASSSDTRCTPHATCDVINSLEADWRARQGNTQRSWYVASALNACALRNAEYH